MKLTIKWLCAGAMAAALLCAPAAHADGIIAVPADLPAKERAELKAAIDAYRAENPVAFQRVRNVSGYKPEVYRKFRHGQPMVSRELRALGAQALLPMLEALAFDMWDRGGATDVEWRALQVGLLDAVGYLDDARAEPVLAAAFDNAQHPDVQAAAAEALGIRCSQAAFDQLAGALSGDRRQAAIAGLGQCRSKAAAELLAAELGAAKTAADAQQIAKALGYVSSSWAWRTLGKDRAAEGMEVRRIASAALVRGFVRHTGATRDAHRVSLSMARHPDLRSIVGRHAKQGDKATRDALERIVQTIEARK